METKTEWTAQEVAEFLGYNVMHVYRLLKQNRIKSRQFNRVWIIPASEAERIKAGQDVNGRFWW